MTVCLLFLQHVVSVVGTVKGGSPQVNRSRPISAQYNKVASNNILTRAKSNEDSIHVSSNRMVSFFFF